MLHEEIQGRFTGIGTTIKCDERVLSGTMINKNYMVSMAEHEAVHNNTYNNSVGNPRDHMTKYTEFITIFSSA